MRHINEASIRFELLKLRDQNLKNCKNKAWKSLKNCPVLKVVLVLTCVFYSFLSTKKHNSTAILPIHGYHWLVGIFWSSSLDTFFTERGKSGIVRHNALGKWYCLNNQCSRVLVSKWWLTGMAHQYSSYKVVKHAKKIILNIHKMCFINIDNVLKRALNEPIVVHFIIIYYIHNNCIKNKFSALELQIKIYLWIRLICFQKPKHNICYLTMTLWIHATFYMTLRISPPFFLVEG